MQQSQLTMSRLVQVADRETAGAANQLASAALRLPISSSVCEPADGFSSLTVMSFGRPWLRLLI